MLGAYNFVLVLQVVKNRRCVNSKRVEAATVQVLVELVLSASGGDVIEARRLLESALKEVGLLGSQVL